MTIEKCAKIVIWVAVAELIVLIAWIAYMAVHLIMDVRYPVYNSTELIINMSGHDSGKVRLKMYAGKGGMYVLRHDSTFGSVGQAIRDEYRQLGKYGLKITEDSSSAFIMTREGLHDTTATVTRYFSAHK